MKMYIVEIHEPTNGPYNYITKKIFSTREDAENYIQVQTEGAEYEEIQPCEWDECGPNWERIKSLQSDWDIIYLDEIDN